jgi:hypothetical protein
MFGGVLAVFQWCLGGIEGLVFSWLNCITCQYKIGVKGTRNFAIGVVCWII